MNRFAIIVAGGSGSRMKTDLPKQFLELKGKPVIMHTLEAFSKASIKAKIILVLNVDYHDLWESLIQKHSFTVPHILVKGGNTRFHSVKNGLKHVEKNSIVAVHDAVRPMIDEHIILNAYNTAEEIGNAVVAIKVKDSIRKMQGEKSESLNREDYYLIQTPQVFQSDKMLKAYQAEYRNEFTDDASVMERSGEEIHLIEGNQRNIKITFMEDLIIASAFLKGV